MTTGEKIKKARNQIGMSQEQMAEKLNVSRSAVAKWESENGLPDIENLKATAKLLGVSVDYLLSESAGETIRISIDITKAEGKNRFEKKNNLIKDRYPSKDIYVLQADEKLTKSEKLIDNLLGFFTDASFGTVELINSFNNVDKTFYLIEGDGKTLIAMVTDEFMEIRECEEAAVKKKFTSGDWKLTKTKIKI